MEKNINSFMLLDDKVVNGIISDLDIIKHQIRNLVQSKDASPKDFPTYLNRAQVCELCGNVSMVTLHNWRTKGLLTPSKQAGRKPLYLRSEVEQFLSQTTLGKEAKVA